MGDAANTSQVMTTNDHDQMTIIELDEVLHLFVGDLKLDRIINLAGWVRVTDGSSIVYLFHEIQDTLGALLHTAEKGEACTVEEKKKEMVTN